MLLPPPPPPAPPPPPPPPHPACPGVPHELIDMLTVQAVTDAPQVTQPTHVNGPPALPFHQWRPDHLGRPR